MKAQSSWSPCSNAQLKHQQSCCDPPLYMWPTQDICSYTNILASTILLQAVSLPAAVSFSAISYSCAFSRTNKHTVPQNAFPPFSPLLKQTIRHGLGVVLWSSDGSYWYAEVRAIHIACATSFALLLPLDTSSLEFGEEVGVKLCNMIN